MTEAVPYLKQVEADGSASITVFLDGAPYVATDTHPNFQKISAQVESQVVEGLADLFDVERQLVREFKQVSDRVSISQGVVYFDGDPVHDVLATHIARALDQGNQNWKSMVAFWENIAQNPNEHSREHIFRWLMAEDFAINEKGHIIGYKGVTTDLGSVHHGPAVVNGVAVNGSVPNKPGSVITMGRAEVQHDPGVGCSVGLHVGTFGYASSFGSVVMQVSVNPRDVVSVPTDCSDQKMRVCRYEVEGIYRGSSPYTGAVVGVEDYTSEAEVPDDDFDDDDDFYY